MPKYEIHWTHETWYKAKVEAKDKAEAFEKFWAGEYADKAEFGNEIADDVEAVELPEATPEEQEDK